MPKSLLVLGGYGGAGEKICRLLLKETRSEVVVAGRRQEKAEGLSEILDVEFPGRASAACVDASKPDSVDAAFGDVDMVVVASTTSEHTEAVARAALKAEIDYIDIHYPQGAARALEGLRQDISSSGLCFVTQAGFFPGLPSAMIRLAAIRLGVCRRAAVAMAMNTAFERSGALYEFLDSMAEFSPEVYRRGRWRFAPWEARSFDFGRPLGRKACYPAMLAEMRGLPESLGLDEAGVYTAGLNPFVDYLVIPPAYVLGRIRRGLFKEALATMTIWGLRRFSRPEEELVIVLEAEGVEGSRIRAVVEYGDVYYMTAAPVVSCARKILKGPSSPGLWMMGHLVEPEALMEDLLRMGIRVEVAVSPSRASVKKD